MSSTCTLDEEATGSANHSSSELEESSSASLRTRFRFLVSTKVRPGVGSGG